MSDSDVVGAVDLETAKKQLRVEYTEDDALITAYIAAATAQCEQICGREIVKRADSNALCESVDTVPAAVKTWVLLTVTDLYEKRGASESPVATGRRFYDHLLDGYRTF